MLEVTKEKGAHACTHARTHNKCAHELSVVRLYAQAKN